MKSSFPTPKDRSFQPRGGTFTPNTRSNKSRLKDASLSDEQEEREGRRRGAELTSGARTRTPAPWGGGGLDAASMAGSGGGLSPQQRRGQPVAGRGGAGKGGRRGRCWFFFFFFDTGALLVCLDKNLGLGGIREKRVETRGVF